MNLIKCRYLTVDYYGSSESIDTGYIGHFVMFVQNVESDLQALVINDKGVPLYTHPSLIKLEGIGVDKVKSNILEKVSTLTRYVSPSQKGDFLKDLRTLINEV